MNNSLIIIAHNIRSAHNVGSLMRTCEGLGVDKLLLTGYTPYPLTEQDKRLPHIARKLEKQITKTSLGAEKSLSWQYNDDLSAVLKNLTKENYKTAALEQHPNSIKLNQFQHKGNLAIILGNEVEGVDEHILALTDITLEIPMFGKKESFNVVEAATMAIYHCKFFV
jgi:23S rRNA (guanosine2251-2'-O)-methyltransferase